MINSWHIEICIFDVVGALFCSPSQRSSALQLQIIYYLFIDVLIEELSAFND